MTASQFRERVEEAQNGRYYVPDQAAQFIDESIKGVKLMKKRGREYVYNCPAAFDIETTSFYRDNDGNVEKAAIMYEWTFGLNGNVMIGRTWGEFYAFLDVLISSLQLAAGVKHLVVYVHNLAFEMGFIQNRFEWYKVFALTSRRPIYAVTNTGIEFRCSFILSGYSLDMVGQNLIEYKVRKLTGSYDYDVVRNQLTYLTPQEIQYCINDVLVVMCYIMERIQEDKGINRLQLTKTGYVRKLVRDNCLYGAGAKSHNYKHDSNVGYQFRTYTQMIRHLSLTPQEYEQSKRAFQGGFTHANGFAVCRDQAYKNVTSYDFTSSYPAVMVAEMYPMTQGELYTPRDYDDFMRQQQLYCCMFDIEFTNIESSFVWEHYISRSRCLICEDPVIDNGRVVSASRLLITLTEVDYDIVKRMYTWQHATVYNFRRYRRNYLPREYVGTILTLYETKTQLKDVTSSDGTIERRYQSAKANLNALYGMTVTDICRPDVTFTGGEWHEIIPDLDEAIEKYNTSKTRFLSYLWGVWVTAYARHNLFTAILTMKSDYLYSDTDSVKVLNADRYAAYFERYNREIVRKLDTACKYHKFDPERTRPKNSKGEVKQLGVWDYEDTYTRFKTLGAKRYLTETKKGIKITVAGLAKQNAVDYLTYKYKTPDAIFDAFTDDLEIPAEYTVNGQKYSGTGKNTHTYIENAYSGKITDYQGHTAEYNELSGVHLEAAGYGLSMADEYVKYLLSIQEVEL